LNIPISSEIELLFARCLAPIVGITGSAGKTTTTTLVGTMLATRDQPVFVGGNIGVPLIEHVDDIPATAWVVLELSSYQLEELRQSPHLGAILNVTPNHLDRHPTFEHYRECKFNLLRYQRADHVAILGADDPVAASLAERCPSNVRLFSAERAVPVGSFRRGRELIVRDSAGEAVFSRIDALRIPGAHNVLNILAAASLARAAGVPSEAIGQVAATFRGVEHRMEFVRELDGISYFNDSIATSPERTVAALRSFAQPVVLIAGGRSKHLPTEELGSTIASTTRAVITFGEMAVEIEDAVARQDVEGTVEIERATSLADAVARARRHAGPGDVVVLSPAGTSFDQFRDFEERGHAFKAIVAALAEES
jgi:UDP-N-acetylmuramoylalanine--D-glutamate ligase